MFAYISGNLLWSQGGVIVGALVACLLVGVMWHKLFIYIALIAFLFCLYFFRNPIRTILPHPQYVYAPADGTIVDWAFDPLGGLEGFAQRISIFLSPFDVHVQRAPVDGTIEVITYTPGTFMPAFLPKSSQLNERNDVLIESIYGRIKIRQISGTIARCIVCWKEQKDVVRQGDEYGMIKFGSRVDIFLPHNVNVIVKKGQRVTAGITALGRWDLD